VLVEGRIVRIDAPIMVAASLALIAALTDGAVSRSEGAALLGCLVVYTVFTFWKARREPPSVREEFAAAAPGSPSTTSTGAFFVLAGLAVLFAGGQILVNAAVDLAEMLEISEAAIGLTIVAVGTSLPELATSVVASLRRQGDIALGNIVGSNIFNIFGILGVTAIVRAVDLGGITWIDLGVMVTLACALSLIVFVRPHLGRSEAALLLVAFVAYTSWLLVA
jgi:cation:H+ antiporter